jgi:hypothetical protein
MPDRALLNTSDAPRYPSPLWIIALFIALSETTTGVAAIVTEGAIALIFTIFAVTFPLVVLSVFIWLLLNHPGNLYSPWQYPQGTSIEGYVAALSRETRRTTVVLGAAIGEAVATAAAADYARSDIPAKRDDIRRMAADTFDKAVSQSSITVDRSRFFGAVEPVHIPVASDTTVDELLDSIFFTLSPSVEPFTYNKSWVLADSDLVPRNAMGTLWAQRQGRQRDERSLADAGMIPGSTLIAVPLTHTTPNGH